MVNAGTKHFKGNLEQLDNADTASTIYRALRLYNSGGIDEANLSDGLKATPSYVSDIANRLQGRTNGWSLNCWTQLWWQTSWLKVNSLFMEYVGMRTIFVYSHANDYLNIMYMSWAFAIWRFLLNHQSHQRPICNIVAGRLYLPIRWGDMHSSPHSWIAWRW